MRCFKFAVTRQKKYLLKNMGTLNKSQLIGILIVGMTLGTAWAVRGQFGNEQGAAWAGAIGALALVLVSKRNDWYRKILSVAFVAAIGWGMTGMISYGRVVGYGRAGNFPNAFYGLLMLFVIGGLFGLLFIALMAFISISIHDGMQGAHNRFELN